MKALLFPLIMAISAGGGVVVADVLRGDGGAAGAYEGDAKDAHAKDDKGHGGKDAGKGDDKAHGDKAGKKDKGYGGGSGDTEYVKFKRQFVVPVLKNQSVSALILLNLGLEVPESQRDVMFRMEPRFRDAFIRELLQMSDDGYFDQELTSPDTYEVLRETLLRAAREIAEDDIKDILILDLSRQDR
ncbi:MAG: flagellar basal body-associated FliL family protein [Litorimonas sp.]